MNENDVFRRRQAMINLAAGRETPDDIEALVGAAREDRYGKVEEISLDNVSGSRYSVPYNGQNVQYFLTSEGAWLTQGDIRIDYFYKVVEEGEKTIHAKRVQGPAEIQNFHDFMMQKIRDIVSGQAKRRQARMGGQDERKR